MKNRILKFVVPILIGLILLISLSSACSKPVVTPIESPKPSPVISQEATIPTYGGTLRIFPNAAVSSDIGWPADMMANMSATIIQVCFDTLLRGDNKGNIIPWLAESYKIADDMKSITFNLRKGIKFHDGSEFNAEVAKWNLDNYINAKMEPNWSSVDIIDDYIIRVNLTQWTNTSPMSFADSNPEVFMVSKAAFDKNGLEWMRSHPVGTGPFEFVSYQTDVSLKYKKNPNYWVKGKPYLDGIEYVFIDDQQTRETAAKAGEGDYANISAGKEAADYASMGLKVQLVMNATVVLIPDTANAASPWANQRVREAVEYAIDREAIAKSLGYGYLQAPYQMPPRDSLAYNSNFTLGRQYNPDKAKQLLTEAGYPDGFETTIIGYFAANRDITGALQADLAKVGIQAELSFPQGGAFMTYMGPNGAWPNNSALFMSIPYMDVTYSGGLDFMLNQIGQSWLRTPELKQAYQAALSSPVVDIELIRACTDIITKDALIIPVHEDGAGIAHYPYVVTSFNERGTQGFWNSEDAWLAK
jgi:peptide/nickel transport system substrate-binding protein